MSDKKKPFINYTARDFQTIKEELLNYAEKYYPDSFQDFNEASFGSLMLDSVAYVGDLLSFYLDYQANEGFLDSANEYTNVVRLAKQLGFNALENPSSSATVDFYIIVPSVTSGMGPNTDYLPVLKQGSTLKTTSGNNFILTENVDFSNSSALVTVANVNASGVPLDYAIKMTGKVVSGKISQENIFIGDYEKFLRIPMSDQNIVEVISVFDSEGREYYEVDYLSQDVIYKEINNTGTDDESVLNILRPYSVPRRFVLENDENKNYFLQFGYGSDSTTAGIDPLDPSNVVLKMYGKDYITDLSFDPSKLKENSKFGVVPQNTSLRVRYRVNPPGNVNAAVGTLRSIGNVTFNFRNASTLNATTTRIVKNSLEVYNSDQIVGDLSLSSSEEVRRRTFHHFATQNRAVTANDYQSIVYAMPARFGAIKRCSVIQDPDSFKRNLNLYILAEGADTKLSLASSTLKDNLKTWISQYKMVNDTIDILDGKIVNVGIDFDVVVEASKNKFDVLQTCLSALKEKYKQPNLMGENLYITDVYKTLNAVTGVVDTKNVKFHIKSGDTYSSSPLRDLSDFTSADYRYIKCPINVAYEVKYLDQDIKGSIR